MVLVVSYVGRYFRFPAQRLSCQTFLAFDRAAFDAEFYSLLRYGAQLLADTSYGQASSFAPRSLFVSAPHLLPASPVRHPTV